MATTGRPAPGRAVRNTPGSAGLGDPFYPLGGNGGYEVGHYSLVFSYDPATRLFDGTTTITATATQDLSRFDLDLRGFDIGLLTVNGAAASFTRDGQELVITPAAGLPTGAVFTVVVGYSGIPQVITDPDDSIEGFVPTDDGAFVVGEPQGSPGWYPANDNPRDKATFDFTATVPAGLTVMANGVLESQTTAGGRTTFVWRSTSPMAPYLATATLGRFDVTQYTLPSGIPAYVAIDPTLPKGNVLRKLPDIVDFYSIYNRGAMTLQALREKIGDGAFFEILRRWAAEHRYGNVTTPQFVALAEQVSGVQLDHFFDVWLYQPDKPTSW